MSYGTICSEEPKFFVRFKKNLEHQNFLLRFLWLLKPQAKALDMFSTWLGSSRANRSKSKALLNLKPFFSGKLDHIPMATSRHVENILRRERAYKRKVSKEALDIERRIEKVMIRVIHNLEPPYVKPKRVEKYKRRILKKKIIVKPVRVVEITQAEKFIKRAFYESDYEITAGKKDPVVSQETTVQFDFDHFLKMNGYTPNYNFKTQIELRDGPEVGRFMVQSLVPEVLEKVERWEAIRKRQTEESIAKNIKIYQNIT